MEVSGQLYIWPAYILVPIEEELSLSGRGIEDKVFMPGIEPASSSHAF
jgi:hypothetical protein